MPAQEIDRTPFAPHRVGDFGDDHPAELPEPLRGCTKERGVALVENSIQVRAKSVHHQLRAEPEGTDDPAHRGQARPIDLPPLDIRDDSPAEARPVGKIPLAPTS